MKKPARGSGGRRGQHPDDDHVLWESVAETIKPLQRKSRVHEASAAEPSDATTPVAKKLPVRLHAPYSPAPPAPPAKVPPLADFDPRHAKKIRSGRVEIERRVDLHGMRRSQAHAVLRRFLFECHAEGRRCVLVITGKGGPRRRREQDDFAGWGPISRSGP